MEITNCRPSRSRCPEEVAGARRWLPLWVLQPLLSRIVHCVGGRHPELLDRLGPHAKTRFLIDPTDLPFGMLLRLDPAGLVFRACHRSPPPPHDARISATFLGLLRLIDCDRDGDAMFFSRDLEIAGNTEAVVSLRNAIDNVEGSIAESGAAAFGLPGRAMLLLLRQLAYSSLVAEQPGL